MRRPPTPRRRSRADRVDTRPAPAPRRTACVEPLEQRRYLALFLNNIDSDNLGKGMWAWTLSSSMSNDGYSNQVNWFNYLKNTQHLDYLITKAGNGDSLNSQYTATMVNNAHNAGLKIVPYFYIYGDASDENPTLHHSSTEAAVFNQVFGAGGPGGDFAIFDIESEYGDNDSAGLINYFNLIGKSQSGNGSGTRDRLFMAYSTFDILHFHNTQFPVKTIADYCDAAMPQMYWKAHGYTIEYDLGQVDTDFDSTTLLGSAGLKPVIPTGQTYNSGTGLPTAAETNQWYNAIKNDTNAVGPVGVSGWRYKSLNYFDEHTTTAALRTEIAAEDIGDLPGNPTITSPANGANNVAATGLVLNWSDVVNTYGVGSVGAALYYDVYLDNMSTPAATISYSAPTAPVSQWSVPGTLSPGTHSWKIVARNMFGSNPTSTVWTFTVAPPAPTNISPTNGTTLNSIPALDWSDAISATSYDVYVDAAGAVNVPGTSTYTPASLVDGGHSWRVVARNGGSTSPSGSTWSFTLDRVAPTASYGGQAPTTGASSFDFTVTYADATSGVNTSTFDDSDITVTGPNGFSGNASFISAAGNVATYRLSAPGGTWDNVDVGTYTVGQNANQVKDQANNARAAGMIGTFDLNFAFAYQIGATLYVAFDGTTTPITLATAGANITASRGATTLSFGGVTAIAGLGTSSDDFLQINGPVAPPLTFSNDSGHDSLRVLSGSYTIASDLSPSLRNVAVTVDAGASATFEATQHLEALVINGSATLTAAGNKVLATKDLTLGAAATLNLGDNDLVLDYSSISPVGTWTGSAYDGVSGMVQSGRNGGSWNGNGIVSSDAAAAGGLTSLAVAEASQVLKISGNETGLFSGETVDASAVLVKFTYAGDANLSGGINVDDYGAIDFNLPLGNSHWFNGDFNYDGKINVDDYGIIDFNVAIQGAAL